MNNYPPQPPTPQQPVPPRSYTCPYCGTVSAGAIGSCPACGAPINMKASASQSGWLEMPGIKDMARLQFGNSFCQIEGKYVPVADMNLAQGDSVYFTHHVLLWKETQVTIRAMSMRGGWKRLFAGLPLIMTEALGPGHVAFSHDAPGEIVALPLQKGHAIDTREHVFMVATSQVTYDWFNSNIWFSTRNGSETETHYPLGMFMDRFYAPEQPGIVLIQGKGNVFIRTLAAGETILVKPTALLFKDYTVQMHLHFETPGGTWRSWRSWGERYVWLRLYGPGRVAIESAFEHMEDRGNSMVSSSQATWNRW
ncbi:MAG: AIM24 family protein [Chloroflexota bacterium]